MANSIRELVGCLLDGFRALLLELSKFRVNKSWKTMFHQHCCSRAEELEGFWGVLGHCWNQKQSFQGTELFPVLVQKGEASHHKLALRYPQHWQWAMSLEFQKQCLCDCSIGASNSIDDIIEGWVLFIAAAQSCFHLPVTSDNIHLKPTTKPFVRLGSSSYSTCTINGGALTCHWWRSGEWCPHPQSCRRDRDRW